MAFIKIKNIDIYYEKKGMGNKKIVFVHGNSLSSKLFDKQFEDEKLLAEYELIRFDLPGFGKSNHAFDYSVYSLPGFSRVFKEFYQRLVIGNAILVGNSLGGHLILETIDGLNDVKGVVINGTPPFAIPPAENVFLPHPAINLFFQGKHTSQELDVLVGSLLHNNEFASLVKDEIGKSDSSFRNVWMANFQQYLPKDEIEVVKNLAIPIAVLHGGKEKLINLEYLKTVPFKNLWKNKVVLINNAGHLPFLEQPQSYNDCLLGFCKQVFLSTEAVGSTL